MKKFILFCFATLLCSTTAWAQIGPTPSKETFSAPNDDGVMIYYVLQRSEVFVTKDAEGEYEYEGNIVIPATVDYSGTTYEVLHVDAEAFYSASKLTSVTLPACMSEIGVCAFSDCANLKSITLLSTTPPECSTDDDGDNPFDDEYFSIPFDYDACTLYVPEGCVDTYKGTDIWKNFTNIKEIGDNGDEGGLKDGDTFYAETEGLYYKILSVEDKTVEVTFGDGYIDYGVPSLGTDAYTGSKTIPTSTTYKGETYSVVGIGYHAFFYCTQLVSVTIPEGIKSIGDAAFRSCQNLSPVTLPESVENLGDSIFFACTGGSNGALTEVRLPSQTKRIPKHMFHNCCRLATVNIPEELEEVDDYAFYGCSWATDIGLASLELPETVTRIGENAFNACAALTKINIPSQITTIELCTFMFCQSLPEITIPEGVTSIGEQAFSYCSAFTDITLPESMTSIGRQAFYECNKLAKVYSLNAEPPTVQSATTFTNIDPECVLYVPEGSKEKYENSDYWEDFYNIVEMMEFDIKTLEATNVTDSSATLNGTVTEAYNDPITERGFEYWTGNEEAKKAVVVGDEMTITVTDLAYDTSYTYRAYAVMESGTTEYGDDVEFTTLENTTTGINGIHISLDDENVEGIYSTSGQKLNTTVKGVNIIRYTDGTKKKVLVK